MAKEPKVGEKAPELDLKDQAGKSVKLADFYGKKNVVLYFYPKDDTPGCTKEACTFRDEMPDYGGLDAQVLGVSVDGIDSHRQFASKYSLNFPLLSDTDKKVAQAYGVLNERGSANRATFIIDKQGILRQIFPNVKVDGHSQEVRDVLEGIGARV